DHPAPAAVGGHRDRADRGEPDLDALVRRERELRAVAALVVAEVDLGLELDRGLEAHVAAHREARAERALARALDPLPAAAAHLDGEPIAPALDRALVDPQAPLDVGRLVAALRAVLGQREVALAQIGA